MVSFGGRALPGVQVSIGKGTSDRDAGDMAKALKEVAAALKDIATNGDAATRAVQAVVQHQQAASQASTAQAGIRATQAQRKPVDDLTQAYKQVLEAQRKVRMEYQVEQASAPGSLARYRAGYISQAEERAKLTAAVQAREASTSGRIASALGWLPGLPQGTYLGQMAATAAFPGISGGMLLGLTGIAALAGAPVGTANFSSDQIRQSRTLSSVVGPSGGLDAYSADLQLVAAQRRTGVTDDKTAQGIAAGLGAAGVDRTDALGQAFDLAANAVSVFQLSIGDATTWVGRSLTELGMTSDQLSTFFQVLAQQSLATGTPAANLAASANNPDLMATIAGGSPLEKAALLNTLSQYGGDIPTMREKLSGVLSTHGAGAIGLASMLGLTPDQFNAMQGTPAGAAQLVDRLGGALRRDVAQAGPQVGLSLFNAQLQAYGTGAQFGYAEEQYLLAQQPGQAYSTYLNDLMAGRIAPIDRAGTPAYEGQAAADAGLQRTAAGRIAAGAAAGNEPRPTDTAALLAHQAALEVLRNATGHGPQDGGPDLPGTPNAYDALVPPNAATQLQAQAYINLANALPGALARLPGAAGGAASALGGAVRVTGEAIVHVSLDQAGRIGRVVSIQVPLSNGQQTTQQYVPGGAFDLGGGRGYTPGVPGPR